MIEVNAIKCQDCKDVIYSVATHDFHRCTCGKIFIDGGFDYVRSGWTDKQPEHLTLSVDATKEEMYKDWANSSLKKWNRRFGRIEGSIDSKSHAWSAKNKKTFRKKAVKSEPKT